MYGGAAVRRYRAADRPERLPVTRASAETHQIPDRIARARGCPGVGTGLLASRAVSTHDVVVTCSPEHLGLPGVVEHEARAGWTAFGYELSGGATEREGDLLSFFGEDEESPLLLIDPVDDTGNGGPQEHDLDVLADMRRSPHGHPGFPAASVMSSRRFPERWPLGRHAVRVDRVSDRLVSGCADESRRSYVSDGFRASPRPPVTAPS
jgi:hypothetical protein